MAQHSPITEVPDSKKMSEIGKAALALASLSFIVGTTVTGGALLGDNVTPLGAYLVSRTSIQTVLARKNNKKMRDIVRTPMVEAMKRLYHTQAWQYATVNIPAKLTEIDIATFEKDLSTPQSYEDWRKKIWEHPTIAPNRQSLWGMIAEESFAHYDGFLTAGAMVPCYGLKPQEVIDTLESLHNQVYPFSRVVLVFNGKGNDAAIALAQEWVNRHNTLEGYEKWEMIVREPAGKRASMAAGMRHLKALGMKVIINVDGDTVADSDALLNTIRVFRENPDVHLVTSNVRISNIDLNTLKGNMLKLWTFYRYDQANNLERAAEGRDVICGSGPWLAMLAEDLTEELIEKFLSHTFRGLPVRPGDDRYLTRLLNAQGKGCYYVGDVIVWTESMETWSRFYRQQSRWAQSAHINFLQMLYTGEIWKLSLMSISDLFYLGIFGYLLFGVIIRLSIVFTLTYSEFGFETAFMKVLPYLIAFLLSNLWKGVYSAATNKHWSGMVNSLYVIPNITYVQRAKFFKLFNLTDYSWPGRGDVSPTT